MRKAYSNVNKSSPDVYYTLGETTSRRRSEGIMSYRRLEGVLKKLPEDKDFCMNVILRKLSPQHGRLSISKEVK